MSVEAVVAYIPVLHEGYRRFLARHGIDRPVYLIGRELREDYRPPAKDVRALDPERVARALEAWGYTAHVLTANNAAELSAKRPTLTLPDEDDSHMVVERYFPRAAVRYDTAFLRWDKTRTVKLLEPEPLRTVPETEAYADLARAAEAVAAKSVDWWRQVGAAIAFADGTLSAAHNQHLPHPLAPNELGDPRSNFF
jgi:dCMP deaminase